MTISTILGIPFSNETLAETTVLLSDIIDQPYSKLHHVITANPEIAMKMIRNDTMRTISGYAERITPDGIGVVYASKLLGGQVKERVTGYDLVLSLLEERNHRNKPLRLFLLGADEEIITLAAQNIEQKYPNAKIVGYHNGYFQKQEEEKIAKIISESQTDLLLVGTGSPKQEEFIYRYKPVLQTKVAIGVGGTFDVLSGKVKRAPLIYQKVGMEWLYRLLKNPKRIKRQFSLVEFAILALLVSVGLKKSPPCIKENKENA